MRNNGFKRKEIVESQSDKKSSSKSQESSSFYDRMKNGLGVASAGAWKAAEVALKATTAVLAAQSALGRSSAERVTVSENVTKLQVQGNAFDLVKGGNRTGTNESAAFIELTRETGNALPWTTRERYKKDIKELNNKLDNPPFPFNGPLDTAVGTETHQREQNKGQHLTSDKEKLAAAQAWMEKAKANPSDPGVQMQGRKLLAEIKGEGSTEPEQKNSEQTRRKLQSSCFNWGIPNEVTAIGISDGDGTAIQVTYNLNTINTCADTISNVAFQASETIVCPAGCVESLITNTPEISGLPSSIAQGQTSTGTRYETIACIRTDANGAQTPTVPNSMSTVVYPTGTQGDSSFLQGMPESFNVYPGN